MAMKEAENESPAGGNQKREKLSKNTEQRKDKRRNLENKHLTNARQERVLNKEISKKVRRDIRQLKNRSKILV